MNDTHDTRSTKMCTAAFAATVLVALSLSPEARQMLAKKGVFMTRTAAAAEAQNAARDSTTPPARDPRIAVEEEYRMAVQRGTAQALELFIARHPDDPLAEQARADLRRLPR